MERVHSENGEIKRLEELANFPGLMRLDWFGGVSWNSYDSSNPWLDIFLSPVSQSQNRNVWISNLDNQQHVRIGVGYLPYLSLGQFFYKGRHAPLYRWPKSNSIHFDLDTSEPGDVVKHRLSDRIKEGSYWVSHAPIGRHNWSYAKNSRFKILRGNHVKERPDGTGVERVPCEVVIHEIEVIRYYYTNSQRLCKAVFLGEFSEDRLTKGVVSTFHKKYSFNKETGVGSFVYQHGFVREDAPIIGRILFGPDNLAFHGVWSVAKSITSSRLKNGGNGPGYPHTLFPFSGKTTLTLDGRWLKSLDGTDRFLAYSIHDCTHPFPFRRLEYRDAIDPRGEKAPEAADEMFKGYGGNRNKPGKDHGSEGDVGNSKSNEQPSARALGLHVELSNRCYSGLKGVELELMDPDKCTHRSGYHGGTEENNLINASTGDATWGESSSSPLGMHHRIVRQATITRNLKTFTSAIKALMQMRSDYHIKKLLIGHQVFEEDESYSCFPVVRSQFKPSILLQFSFHDKEKQLPRRFVCYEVEVDGRYGYLFEAESRVRISRNDQVLSKDEMSILFLRRPGFERCFENDFVGFLNQTVIHRGWSPKNDLDGFVRGYTVHGVGAQSIEDLSRRILRMMENIFLGS